MTSSHTIKTPFLAFIFLSLLALVGVGCGGGGGSAPPPPPADEDASGLYNATGSATFTNVNDGSAIPLSRTKGLISGNRFIFFNAEPKANTSTNQNENVLFDGTITSIAKSDLVGTANVYQAGQIVATNVAVTGTVTTRSRVQLTFAAAKGVTGTLAGDFSGGSVDGTFDITEYDKGAAQTTIDSQINAEWGAGNNPDRSFYMKIPEMTGALTMSRTDDSYKMGSVNNSSNERCGQRDGTVGIPDSAVNLYTVGGDTVIATSTLSPCTDLENTTGYSGFAAVVDDSIDGANNGIWYAITNGTYSIFAILSRP